MAIILNNDTKTTGMHHFTPEKGNVNNGISLGKLVDIKIEYTEVKEDGDWVFFRGNTVPRLAFVFEEIHQTAENKDKEPGTFIHTFIPVTPTDVKNPYVKTVTDQIQMIAHFIDAIKGNRQGITITFDESKTEVEDVIKEFTKLYTEVLALLNKDEYKVKYWLKLLLYIGEYEVNKSNPGIGKYVGEGVIEKFVLNADKSAKVPSIKVNIAKGESITPREKQAKKAAAPGGLPTDVTTADPNLSGSFFK